MKSLISSIILLIIFSTLVSAQETKDKAYKVFVVMSYESPDVNPWCKELKEGIQKSLKEHAEIDYFYMDTKINFENGESKALEAFELFKKGQYDGVITADDNAQSMFAAKYLKDKDIPVMFAGVNADPSRYGYPASNISGILERGHIRESIALIKQLSPKIEKIGVIVKESPSGLALKNQINLEKDTYSAEIAAFDLVQTTEDISNRTSLAQCDAFFIDSIEGIKDGKKMLHYSEVISFIQKTFNKPIIGANNSHVKNGALCAVVKTGHEQGEGAADKLLEAMQGKPVAEIPITKNYKGKRIINVAVMEQLNIVPKPISLLGAELIRSE